jgi:hypothetical protein
MYSPDFYPDLTRSGSTQRSFNLQDVITAVTGSVRTGASILAEVGQDAIGFMSPKSTWDGYGVAESCADSCASTTDGGVPKTQQHAEGLASRVADRIGRIFGIAGIDSPAGRSAQSNEPISKPERYL